MHIRTSGDRMSEHLDATELRACRSLLAGFMIVRGAQGTACIIERAKRSEKRSCSMRDNVPFDSF